MFNATNARNTAAAKFETATDQFAAELEDRLDGLSNSRRQEAIDRLNEVVADEAAFAAFVDGGTNQPGAARALGAGSPSGNSPTTEQEALGFLLGSGNLPGGVKATLRRLLDPNDPGHIKVGVDGTPVEVGELRQELASKVADLAGERDASRRGSLAHRLASISASATPVKNEIDKVRQAWARRRPSRTNGDNVVIPLNQREVIDGALDELQRLLP